MRYFSAVLLALCLCSMAKGIEFAKIHNCSIVISAGAGAIEKAAAEELKLHLSKSFTAPAKVNGKVPAKITFFIGNSGESRAAGFGAVKYKGEFCIARKDNAFYFTGCDTRNGSIFNANHECGTFLSVAYFVQKYLQVNFFLPGNNGTSYAKDPEIRFPESLDSPVPTFAMRGFQRAGKGVAAKDMQLFFRRRLGRLPQWSRANYHYYFYDRWNKRFKHKPEFFALHNGRRVNEKYPRHFPCTSNPQVLEQVITDITEAVKKRPSISSIRLFCDAPVRSCECSNCRNSAAGKLIKGNDHGEVVYSFFSKIAKGVQKYRSDLVFHTQTKAPVYYRVPETETLPPNTVLSLLTGHFVAPDYDWVRKVSDQWRKAGAKVILYCYPRPPAFRNYPLINPHRIADHFVKLRHHASGAGFSEGRAKIAYSFSALNNFVHSAVMFDADVDVEKLIDSFCRFAAPRSHAELKAFYTAMEQLLDGAKFWDDPRFNSYTMDRLKNPAALLKQALAKDPDNKFLRELSAEFDLFLKEVEKTAAAMAVYNKLIAEYRKNLPGYRMIDLKSGARTLPLIPFFASADFQQSSVTLSRSSDGITVKAVCREEQMSKIQTLCKKNHQGNIWSDDVIEFIFGNPEQNKPYIHLAVNAAGVYRAQLNNDAGKHDILTPGLKVTHSKGADRWEFQIDVPSQFLAPVSAGGKVKFGAFRYRPSGRQTSGVKKPDSGNFHSDSGRIMLQFN